MSIEEKRAVKLGWDEVCDSVTGEIEAIIGLPIQCKVNPVESEYWDLSFENFRVPISKFCLLLQSTGASLEAWEDALPDEGMVDVGNTGMELAELLLGRHLHFTWEDRLITDDSLWLVGVTDSEVSPTTEKQDLSKLLGEWLDATADFLHRVAADCLRRGKIS